ncbi:TIGR00730 family Rossman fold protein [Lentilactobacillus raoultii]|uniref:Cytokinin riboside 5'-monophosphate phosphoribohydrolase n=1 Tax=Lentilactobacillus raoultii TaxID=1987503 RepID=A0ABW3PEL1_9LACO|nr:TIGR00730 family Rossman fold protein [Lentilactobacillus raoultii]
MKKIAVYCGAASGNDPVYTKAAIQLGDWLVDHHLELVYGGGGIGLMGAISKRVLERGGQVHGIMPKELVERGAELAELAKLSELTVVNDMSTRKEQMMTLSDGCIALPGGVGTLEEMSQAFSWARLGNNPNPCVFFNVTGYYDPLKAMFDQMTNSGFLSKADRDKLLFSDSLSDIYTFMTTYMPPKIRTYKSQES